MTARYVVTRDGVAVSPPLESENDAFAWLLDHQPSSVAHATTHEGYNIQPLPEMDDRDAAILAERQALLDEREGPKVGDFVRFRDGTLRRISYDWGVVDMDGVQTSDGGSFYLGEGYCSFSGGLYPGIGKAKLTPTRERRAGSVWFFHRDFHTAHNGVDAVAEFPVWFVDEEPNR